MTAVKALIAAALIMVVGAAHAADSYEVCGAALDLKSGRDNTKCWVRVMADKVRHGERLDGAECILISAMHGHVSQCDDDEAHSPEEQTRRANQRAAKPGPREIPLCVGNCR